MSAADLSAFRRLRSNRISYEQFLKSGDENRHTEWVDGRVVRMAPVTGLHCEVAIFLLCALGAYVEESGLGKVHKEPFQMKTSPDLPGRAPDLLFVAKRRLRRLHRMYLEGPADLVVEIICHESRTLDRVQKFREYEQGGVHEYWLIDPERRLAEFYRRGRDGRFRLVTIGEDAVYRSAVLNGLWLRIDWLWDRPPLLTVLREWKLI